LAVTDDMPQNSCAPMTMSSRNLAVVSPTASTKICAGGTPVSGAASALS
jgi:hypothetical protein